MAEQEVVHRCPPAGEDGETAEQWQERRLAEGKPIRPGDGES